MGEEAVGVHLRGPDAMLGSPGPRAPGISHGPSVKRGGPAPGVTNARAGSKASSGRRKQTATGGLCQQLLGHPMLGFPRQKMPVGAPRPRLQMGAQGVRKCQRMFKFNSVQSFSRV